ncbi:hypothetical protein TL16_g08530 [Triparma laevis f. inornata]|uniref:Uncharacterized protein n=1 Tax=Triparma laevis f. inornata TaxID=1714386 RepID=A0A9W7B6A5_9STRA|nr:hypothetical protein TL16_g08530 [Triparma laevis f. inornata]
MYGLSDPIQYPQSHPRVTSLRLISKHHRASSIMAAPTLVHSVQLRSTLLRIVQTPCIITKPPPSSSTPLSLVVPTNPFLTSTTKFPYFSTGGPSQHKFESPRQHQADWAPPGFVSNWGGMEIGGGMRYSSQTVDGLVCLHGGKEYQQSLQDMRDSSSTSPHALDEGTSDSPPQAKFLTCPAPPRSLPSATIT